MDYRSWRGKMSETNNFEKKILVVLTGGTICSEYQGNIKSQGNKAGTILEKNFRNSYSKYANKVYFKTTENFGIFSENVTVEKWNEILGKLRVMPEIRDTAIAHGNYPSLDGQTIISQDNVFDGIIIAHGTDTLAYSSALFSIFMRNMGVPVFIVSSNEALSSDNANGTLNFIAAVECICEAIKPNVYVTYRNSVDRTMYLHYASRLTQCKNYQEDFYSFGMVDITNVCSKSFERLPKIYNNSTWEDSERDVFFVDLFDPWKLNNVVLRIDPYVGLNYNFFDFSSVKAILHGTYHSGTVCTEKTENSSNYGCNSILSMLDKCSEIPVYIAPSDFTGGIYDTILIVANHGRSNVKFINGYTMEMLYIKLLIAYSIDAWSDSIINVFLANEYNCEFVIDINSSTQIMYQ